MPRTSLDSQIAAALERLTRVRRAHLQRTATSEGLSALQVELLVLLGADGPPAPRGAELARELDVTTATVGEAVGALRAKGLVLDEMDPEDRRRKVLSLTALGRVTRSRVVEQMRALHEPVSQLTDAQAVGALRALGALLVGYHQAGLAEVDRSCMTCAHRVAGRGLGRCALLDAALTAETVRIDCSEHASTLAALG